MNAPAELDDDDARELELVLTHNGGAELIDFTDEDEDGGYTVWASDSDDDFHEHFPDFLNENDVEALMRYLEDAGVITAAEADDLEISMESLTANAAAEGPGDEDDDDDEDE